MIQADSLNPESGRIVIYDGKGVNPCCVSAAQSQISSLVDGRLYQVELFSAVPSAFDGPRYSPVPLFVIPGGNFRDMARDLEPLTSRIHKLVKEWGSSYLGICAGAIAAGQGLIACEERLKLGLNRGEQQIFKMPSGPCLGLYSGCSCLLERASYFGTASVRSVTLPGDTWTLYASMNPFFPGVRQQPQCTPLLEYAEYGFTEPFKTKENLYGDLCPVAALTQRVGNGILLLSGVHPEISAEVLEGCTLPDPKSLHPSVYEMQKQQRESALQALREACPKHQNTTMRNFLDRLGIHVIPSA